LYNKEMPRYSVRKTVFPLALCLSVFPALLCRSDDGGTEDGRGAWVEPLESDNRRAALPFGPIIAAMNIRPGMSVADLGAGTGFFSFPIAEAMKGSGRVYATETDPKMADALRRRIGERGAANVSAVRVSGEGVDPFYKKHRFDIIFACELYHYLRRPAEYFGALRPSLVPGTGRLFIIHLKNDPDFSAPEFGDCKRTLWALGPLGRDSALFKKAAAGIEDFMARWDGGEVPVSVRERLAANFNAMLDDRGLFAAMLDAYPPLTDRDGLGGWIMPLENKVFPRENRPLMRWLAAELDMRDVFKKEKKEISEDEKRYLRVLNRILLTGVFKTDRLGFIKGGLSFYASDRRIVSDMREAGYELVAAHEILAYHHLLEFKTGGK